jgi:hypothetical protein
MSKVLYERARGGGAKDTERGGWDRRGDGEIVNDVEKRRRRDRCTVT